jgi:hypothetical protein
MTNNITIKNISDIANFGVPANVPKNLKENIIENYLNTSAYEFLGFIDRSNDAVLRTRFHNVRDESGRFATVEATA